MCIIWHRPQVRGRIYCYFNRMSDSLVLFLYIDELCSFIRLHFLHREDIMFKILANSSNFQLDNVLGLSSLIYAVFQILMVEVCDFCCKWKIRSMHACIRYVFTSINILLVVSNFIYIVQDVGYFGYILRPVVGFNWFASVLANRCLKLKKWPIQFQNCFKIEVFEFETVNTGYKAFEEW